MLHQSNPNKLPDSSFKQGTLSYLKEGNHCRLLDGRRTPGIIETIDLDSGMFIWRITDFEDKGRYWELPLERVTSFQFPTDTSSVEDDLVSTYKQIIKQYSKQLVINLDESIQEETYNQIDEIKQETIKWFKNHSRYFKEHKTIDLFSTVGHPLLYDDLKTYLTKQKLYDLEEETTNTFCLNPGSGEMIKGMTICLAELGLTNYNSTITRKEDTFTKAYTKERRKNYLMHRLAFNQTMFKLLNIKELAVFRGMSSSKFFFSKNRSLLSTTKLLDTAKEFFDDSTTSKIKSAYLLKLVVPIKEILFTYLETKEFNKQYLEQEVIIINSNKLPF